MRIIQLSVPVLAAALLVSGCIKRSNVEAGTKAHVFHYANNSEPPDLDPNSNISSDCEPILNALFEGLVVLDRDGTTILPGVAESWDTTSDGLTYTFHLRPDAKWSNGEPVTADDFVFSFRRVLDPKLGAEESSFGWMIQGGEDYNRGRNPDSETVGVTAPDAHTFIVKLAHPSVYFLSVLAADSPFFPVYRPLLEKFNAVHQRGTAWTKPENMVSNGAFYLADWISDKVIVLKRNPNYWGADKVDLAEIRVYPVDDPEIQEKGFRSGQYHATSRFPVHRDEAYHNKKPSVLLSAPQFNATFITFNVDHFPDARVRRALSLALNRDKFVPAVLHDFAIPGHSLVRPSGIYTAPPSSACRFDPAEAKKLLAEAGYPDGKGFPAVNLMLVGNDAETVNIGAVVQQSWKTVLGIQCNLQPTEMKVYLDAERTGNFAAVIERWNPSNTDPTNMLQMGVTGNPNNDARWSNPEFDQMFAEADQSADLEKRERDFDRMEMILADEVPYAPLFHRNPVRLVSTEVKGWQPNPLNHITWRLISLSK